MRLHALHARMLSRIQLAGAYYPGPLAMAADASGGGTINARSVRT